MSALAVAGRTGAWLEEPGLGVYVHIPFCRHRCHYCDFNTYEGRDSEHRPYVDALVADIERTTHAGRPASSVFFGGGTPTLLAPAELARVLSAIRARIGVDADAEITVEANPETVDESSFEALLQAGFNRFSVGVQSLSQRVLIGLGRTHSAERALEAIAAARRAGVDDINADLIFGSPWEAERDWDDSLRGAIDAAPDHISAYALTVETGTPLHTLVATGRVPGVDPDVQASRHERAQDLLGAAGFGRYEISNWARPGRASRHNVLYWSAGDYLAFGAGAHGHLSGQRTWNMRLPRAFIDAVAESRSTREGGESLSPSERAGEALVLGLRLASGVEISGFERRFGSDAIESRSETIAELELLGLIELREGWMRLTSRATLVADEALCRLL